MSGKVGRPSTYPETPEGREALCAQIIALGAEGKSQAQISAEIGVPRATMYRWAKEHDDFRAAISRAKDLELAWWEEQARANLGDRNFNAALWQKSMAGRFPSDYSTKVTAEVSGPGGGSIPIEYDFQKARERVRAKLEALAKQHGANDA